MNAENATVRQPSAAAGFTLIEVLIAVALVGTLAAMAAPALLDRLGQAREERAVNDLRLIAFDISLFVQANEELPDSLSDLGRPLPNDPWGRPYQYRSRDQADWKSNRRKDQFIVPLNSDYDLFSTGADGQWSAPLTARSSRDDIVRACDGAFFGAARYF